MVKTGKELYYESTANDPIIHANRFPTWEELSNDERKKWRKKAAELSPKKALPEPKLDLDFLGEPEVYNDVVAMPEKVNIFQSFSGRELRGKGLYDQALIPSADLVAHLRLMPERLSALIVDDSGIVVDNILHSFPNTKFDVVYYPNPHEAPPAVVRENIDYEKVKFIDHPGEITGKLDLIIFGDVADDHDFYYDALNEGGIIAGRNYHKESVIRAVKNYRLKNRITTPLYVTLGDMWYWTKPRQMVEHALNLPRVTIAPTPTSQPKKSQTHLRDEYVQKYGLNEVFVETGTYLGETLEQIQKFDNFTSILSVDINQGMVDKAREKFKDDPRIGIECADSIDWLEYVVCGKTPSDPGARMTFWLDAHASGPLKGGKSGGSPVLDELRIIKKSKRNDHTIFIDDKRLFGSAEWSHVKLEDALALLKEINPDYKIEYLDGQIPGDVIVAYI